MRWIQSQSETHEPSITKAKQTKQTGGSSTHICGPAQER
jgi:hypothetical protein